MMANPRHGQIVQVWYRASARPHVDHHAEIGCVVIAGRGRPRNHLVRFADGSHDVFPCGNLRKATAHPESCWNFQRLRQTVPLRLKRPGSFRKLIRNLREDEERRG